MSTEQPLKPEPLILYFGGAHYAGLTNTKDVGTAALSVELAGIRWIARDVSFGFNSDSTEIVPAKIMKSNPATKYMKLLEFPFIAVDNHFTVIGKTCTGPYVTTYDHDKWAATPALAVAAYAHRKAYAAGKAKQRLERQQEFLRLANNLLRVLGASEVKQRSFSTRWAR